MTSRSPTLGQNGLRWPDRPTARHPHAADTGPSPLPHPTPGRCLGRCPYRGFTPPWPCSSRSHRPPRVPPPRRPRPPPAGDTAERTAPAPGPERARTARRPPRGRPHPQAVAGTAGMDRAALGTVTGARRGVAHRMTGAARMLLDHVARPARAPLHRVTGPVRPLLDPVPGHGRRAAQLHADRAGAVHEVGGAGPGTTPEVGPDRQLLHRDPQSVPGLLDLPTQVGRCPVRHRCAASSVFPELPSTPADHPHPRNGTPAPPRTGSRPRPGDQRSTAPSSQQRLLIPLRKIK